MFPYGRWMFANTAISVFSKKIEKKIDLNAQKKIKICIPCLQKDQEVEWMEESQLMLYCYSFFEAVFIYI